MEGNPVEIPKEISPKPERENAARELVSNINTNLANIGLAAVLERSGILSGALSKTDEHDVLTNALFETLGAQGKNEVQLLTGIAKKASSLDLELKTDSKLQHIIDMYSQRLRFTIDRFIAQSGITKDRFLRSPAETLTRLLIKDQKTAAILLAAVSAASVALTAINPDLGKDVGKNTLSSLLLTSLLLGRVSDDSLLPHIPNPPPLPPGAMEKIRRAKDAAGKKKIPKGCLLAAGCLVAISCAAALGIGGFLGIQAIDKYAETHKPPPTPTPIPKSDAESLSETYQSEADTYQRTYNEGKIPIKANPISVDDYVVRRQTAYYGVTWFLNESRRTWLEQVFGKSLSSDIITKMKQDPEEFFKFLGQTKNERPNEAEKIQKAIDFYRKRQQYGNTNQDKEKFLKDSGSESYLTPNLLDEEQAIIILNKFNESRLLASGAYKGRKGSFANTGLPKSVILERQKGYRVS